MKHSCGWKLFTHLMLNIHAYIFSDSHTVLYTPFIFKCMNCFSFNSFSFLYLIKLFHNWHIVVVKMKNLTCSFQTYEFVFIFKILFFIWFIFRLLFNQQLCKNIFFWTGDSKRYNSCYAHQKKCRFNLNLSKTPWFTRLILKYFFNLSGSFF